MKCYPAPYSAALKVAAGENRRDKEWRGGEERGEERGGEGKEEER